MYPHRGTLWPRVVLGLGPVDLSSDIPPVEASGGEEWYYIRSADIWSAFGSC